MHLYIQIVKLRPNCQIVKLINKIKKFAERLVSDKICFHEKTPFLCGVFVLKCMWLLYFQR